MEAPLVLSILSIVLHGLMAVRHFTLKSTCCTKAAALSWSTGSPVSPSAGAHDESEAVGRGAGRGVAKDVLPLHGLAVPHVAGEPRKLSCVRLVEIHGRDKGVAEDVGAHVAAVEDARQGAPRPDGERVGIFERLAGGVDKEPVAGVGVQTLRDDAGKGGGHDAQQASV